MTEQARLDVVAVGNALVDVLAPVSDDFLHEYCMTNNLCKGTMTLIDQAQADHLLDCIENPTTASGGSAANTMAGIASFGGKGGFIGKIAKDDLGKLFARDLEKQNIDFYQNPAENGPSTGHCTILISPDGERTMNTFLGASVEITPNDLSSNLISDAQILYLEGYLFDKDSAKNTFIKAAEIAKSAGRKIAMTLSDPFCVDRHRADFLNFIQEHVDILFANEEEIKKLFETDNFDTAAEKINNCAEIIALTRSANGAIILHGDKSIRISALPIEHVIDTTGAGDQFAAGFLYGLTQGKSIKSAGDLGALAAAEVISHIGPRPNLSMQNLLEKAVA